MKFIVLLILSYSASAFSSDIGYNELSDREKKSIVTAINKYMMPYSKALREAHVRVTALLSQCMTTKADYDAYPADLLEYDKNSVCYQNKKISKNYEQIWKDTNPNLRETEYRLYRGYQTAAMLGHEAYGAALLASVTHSMVKYDNYDKDISEWFSSFRHDFDNYISATLKHDYFTRGDGCMLYLNVGIGDNKSKGANLVEMCD